MFFNKWHRAKKTNIPKLLKFEGGMGNQLLNAALYFDLINQGNEVYADLSYFQQPAHIAMPGEIGQVSHWGWQLDHFGIHQRQFQKINIGSERTVKIKTIADDSKKSEMVLNALKKPEIKKILHISGQASEIIPNLKEFNYICIHIRRGDYLNVASHLISDDQFIEQAEKFSGLLKCLVVVSDSLVSERTRAKLHELYPELHILDQTDPWTTHRIMRLSKVLICSNSQFSLIGAILNEKALVLIPNNWFGEGDHYRESEAILRKYSAFMTFNV